MGRETRLIAFPEDWHLLSSVRTGKASGDDIGTVIFYASWLRGKNVQTDATAYFEHDDDPARISVLRETLALLNSNDGLLWIVADIDRRFEVLQYLMLESSTSVEQQQLYRFSISGREVIHPTATGGQGFPIRWNDAKTTREVNDAICGLNFGMIIEHYGTEKFHEIPLYKGTCERREARNLYGYFCHLKEYYRAAAAAGYATIVYVD